MCASSARPLRDLATAAGVELRERRGQPIEQILAAASEPDVAALILGTRGALEGPQPGGHTAPNLITTLAKPAVAVPPEAQPPARFARILVPLEGSARSSRAVDATIEFAHRRKLEILVLHVHSPTTVPAFADHEPHETQAWNREFLARHVAGPHQRVTLLRHVGVPADHVLASAEESGADLLALAWNRNLGAGRAHVVSAALARKDPGAPAPGRRLTRVSSPYITTARFSACN